MKESDTMSRIVNSIRKCVPAVLLTLLVASLTSAQEQTAGISSRLDNNTAPGFAFHYDAGIAKYLVYSTSDGEVLIVTMDESGHFYSYIDNEICLRRSAKGELEWYNVGYGSFKFEKDQKTEHHELRYGVTPAPKRGSSPVRVLLDLSAYDDLLLEDVRKSAEGFLEGTGTLHDHKVRIRKRTSGKTEGKIAIEEVTVFTGDAKTKVLHIAHVRIFEHTPCIRRIMKEDLSSNDIEIRATGRVKGNPALPKDPPLPDTLEQRVSMILKACGISRKSSEGLEMGSGSDILLDLYRNQHLSLFSTLSSLRMIAAKVNEEVKNGISKAEKPKGAVAEDSRPSGVKAYVTRALGKESLAMDIAALLKGALAEPSLSEGTQEALYACVWNLRLAEAWEGVPVTPEWVLKKQELSVKRVRAAYRCGIDTNEETRETLLGGKSQLDVKTKALLVADRIEGGLPVSPVEVGTVVPTMLGDAEMRHPILGFFASEPEGRNILWSVAVDQSVSPTARDGLRGVLAWAMRNEPEETVKAEYLAAAKKLLKSDNPTDRRWGVQKIAYFGSSAEATPVLQEALKDKESSVRKASLSMIGLYCAKKKLQWKDFEAMVIQSYMKGDAEVKMAAAGCLRDSGQAIPDKLLDQMVPDVGNTKLGYETRETVLALLAHYSRQGEDHKKALAQRNLSQHLPKQAKTKYGKQALELLSKIQ